MILRSGSDKAGIPVFYAIFLRLQEIKFMVGNDKIISGDLFSSLLFSGAVNLKFNIGTVNELNVFPIPDGDTGDNMYFTLKGGVDKLKTEKSTTIGAKANALAQGMLLNARGNSGVILSQLFFGLSEGLFELKEATLTEFADAMQRGVARAYSAVAEPVEGTILTVAREPIARMRDKIDGSTTAEEFFDGMLAEMKRSLEKTPELLEVLKESGVIDSGGAGLVCIIEGFCKVFKEENNPEEIALTEIESNKNAVDFSKFNEDSVMEFGYCTEMLVQLTRNKTDVDAFSVDEMIAFLNGVGDSIVAFKIGTVVKLHVHTMTPWKVMEYCQRFGEFLSVKVENMTLQHNESAFSQPETSLSEINGKVKKARKKFAVVTVANGEGLSAVFKELGADYVISGGQTDNPSAEDFIKAFDAVNADYIFVLPNNGNIVLSAKQAADIYKYSDVRVVPSKSVGEGYSALSMLDYGSDDADKIESSLKENTAGVVTGLVTHAVRTTVCNGVQINKGDYIGFANQTMYVSTPSKTETVFALSEKLVTADKSFIIVAYGKDATVEERQAYADFVSERFPDVEFYEIDGEQEVYDFIIIIE